jgi:hypothetical protein
MSDLEARADSKEAHDLPNEARNGDSARVADAAGANDLSIYPKGTLDPVYEAKAKILNRAVSATDFRASEQVMTASLSGCMPAALNCHDPCPCSRASGELSGANPGGFPRP